jgi:hypothetical protein
LLWNGVFTSKTCGFTNMFFLIHQQLVGAPSLPVFHPHLDGFQVDGWFGNIRSTGSPKWQKCHARTDFHYQVHVDFSVSIGDRNSLGGPPGSAAHLPQCDKSHAWD